MLARGTMNDRQLLRLRNYLPFNIRWLIENWAGTLAPLGDFAGRTSNAREDTMTNAAYRSTRPDRWTLPRPHQDASLRYQVHGPIRPMDYDERRQGFWRRLFPG